MKMNALALPVLNAECAVLLEEGNTIFMYRVAARRLLLACLLLVLQE